MKTWTATVEPDLIDPESVMIAFPEELMESMGWVVGDSINWDLQPDGSVILTKVTP